MVEPENKLFTLKDGWASQETREQQRLKALTDLGLRQPETIPVFEEATQTAAHFLEAQICILGFVDSERHWFKSAVGLSRLGLMNQLAQSRQLSRRESFCTKVVETSQIVAIDDTHLLTNTERSTYSKLLQEYGIRAYLGAPLFDASGSCLGALAVMDLVPRKFTTRDVEFLQIIARWSMSEFERNRLLQASSNSSISMNISNWSFKNANINEIRLNPTVFHKESIPVPTNQLKLSLLAQLTQELRTPLTSVLGMAGVLGREIYGPLTTKQREYLEIIQHSGRYLLSLVNEISELGTIDETPLTLNLAPVDIEMLCQQAINTLEEAANRREQDIRLSIEPGRSRILPLDKDKVRQILYHLVFNVIQVSATGSVVRIHVAYKDNLVNITVWVSHPWLGDGIADVEPYFRLQSLAPMLEFTAPSTYSNCNDYSDLSEDTNDLSAIAEEPTELNPPALDVLTIVSDLNPTKSSGYISRESLGLELSCRLAHLHGGQISVQGSSESGYRYVLSLPLMSSSSVESSNEF